MRLKSGQNCSNVGCVRPKYRQFGKNRNNFARSPAKPGPLRASLGESAKTGATFEPNLSEIGQGSAKSTPLCPMRCGQSLLSFRPTSNEIAHSRPKWAKTWPNSGPLWPTAAANAKLAEIGRRTINCLGCQRSNWEASHHHIGVVKSAPQGL